MTDIDPIDASFIHELESIFDLIRSDHMHHVAQYDQQRQQLDIKRFHVQQINATRSPSQQVKNGDLLKIYENKLHNWLIKAEGLAAWNCGGEFVKVKELDPLKRVYTNQGSVKFYQKISDSSIQYAVKYSELLRIKFEFGHIAGDDPAKESLLIGYTSKDHHAGMLSLVNAHISARLYIQITPKAPNFTLLKYIQAHSNLRVPLPNLKQILNRLFYNIDYLHNHLGIAHMDLKPENIFLDQRNLPIIGDLGTAQIAEYDHEYNLYHLDSYSFRCIDLMTRTIRGNIQNTPIQSRLEPFSVSYGNFKLAQAKFPAIRLSNYTDGFNLNCLPISPVIASKDPTRNPETIFYSQFLQSHPSASRAEFFTSMISFLSTNVHYRPQWSHETIDDELQVLLSPSLSTQLYSLLIPNDLSQYKSNRFVSSLGTTIFMAPEVLVPSTPYDAFKADIYSLGVVVFVMLYGFQPYAPSASDPAYSLLLDHSKRSSRTLITSLVHSFGLQNTYDSSVTELLDGMMDFNPETRFNIKQVIQQASRCSFP